MPTCPFCRAQYGPVELATGICPRCQHNLPLREPPASIGSHAPVLDAGQSHQHDIDQDAISADEVPLAAIEEEGEHDNRGSQDRSIGLSTSSDLQQKVSIIWGNSSDDSSQDGIDINATQDGRSSQTRLILQQRNLSETGAVDVGGADYELLELLGEGGMGVVYTARQASINRKVALKMLKTEQAENTGHRKKFLSEAILTGELEHPNIVPIYDLATNDQGALFYSMKHVKGLPWEDERPKKSLDENIDILMRVCDAVAFAHSNNIIHRDLKPENIMLGGFGEVLVMDWGLATTKEMKGQSGMGGTPAFMAPEMATGPIEKVGPHSDVYLLGGILYEIITDKQPHCGDTAKQCLVAAAKNEIQPTEKSGELVSIALKAMSTQPADRYASVAEFQTAIREYQAHSESIALATRAREDLDAAQNTEDYQLYARSVFGFEEAFQLWPGNTKAKSGKAHSQLAYATAALKKEDFDLGVSLLDPSVASHRELSNRLERAQRDRNARQRRLKSAKRIGTVLALTLFLVITGAVFWVRLERDKALVARDSAITAQKDAETAKLSEAKERIKAEESQQNSEIAQKKAEIAQKKAETAHQKAVESRDAEAEARTAEKEQRQRAEDALEQQEYATYIARIGLAAAKIQRSQDQPENAFKQARDLLNACNPSLRNWEWERLSFLCKQHHKEISSKSPISCIAYSPDGSQIVTGDWNGTARIWDWDTDSEQPRLKINITDESQPTSKSQHYVFAVAFSPDGKQIATGSNDRHGYVRLWNATTGDVEKTLQGHRDAVVSVAFSQDGKKLLTGSYDETARLWNLSDDSHIEFRGHEWWVWSARFSPDHKRIVTASQDGTAMVWDADTGARIKTFWRHGGPVLTADFSPDGKLIASGDELHQVYIWDPMSISDRDYRTIRWEDNRPPKLQKVTAELAGHPGGVRCLRFSPDGHHVLSGGNDNTLRYWDVASGKLVKELRGHGGPVQSCVFSPSGDGMNFVASGSLDSQAKIWNIAKYDEVRVLDSTATTENQLGIRQLVGHGQEILTAVFSPDGRSIATASRDRTVKIWNPQSGQEIQSLREGHAFLTTRGIFFPKGDRVITSAVDNTTRIWDVNTGRQMLILEGTGSNATVTLSHNTRWILTGGDDRQTEGNQPAQLQSASKSARLWDAHTGKLIRELPGHQEDVTAVAFSADDRWIFTGDRSGRGVLWDTETGEIIFRIPQESRHRKKITDVKFSLSGRQLFSSSLDRTVRQWKINTSGSTPELTLSKTWSHADAVIGITLSADQKQAWTSCRDHQLRVWDVATANLLQTIDVDGKITGPVDVSPDAMIAVVTPNTETKMTQANQVVRLWSLDTNGLPEQEKDAKVLYETKSDGENLWFVKFSPDAQQILTVGGDGAQLWDRTTRQTINIFAPHGPVASVKFSQDGQYLVTAGWDNTARIWNVATGQTEQKLIGHRRFVNDATFSPDGKKVVTASDDHTARIWDVATAREIQQFREHQDKVSTAVFSSDGQRILTASSDGKACIWDAATGEIIQQFDDYQQPLLAAVFSPNGKYVLAGGEDKDNTARIWNLKTKKPMLFDDENVDGLLGHTDRITSVAFSPDGLRVVTGSADRTAKVWELRTGREVLTLRHHQSALTSVTFSPDGRHIVTASRDKTAIIWMAAPWPDKIASAVE